MGGEAEHQRKHLTRQIRNAVDSPVTISVMFSTADKIYFGLQLVAQVLIAVWIALYHFKHEQASRIVAVLTVVCIAATFIAFWFTTWATKMSGLGAR